jgi:drug/metabolite transporter (DMT)-like permease
MNLALGIFFGMLSSASFGLNGPTVRRGTLKGTASQALYFSIFLGVPLFFLAAAATGQLFRIGEFDTRALALLASAGVLHFLFGRYCNYRCVSAIGAMRSQPLRSTSLIYSLAIAVMIFGEHLTLGTTIGAILLGIGALLMVEQPRKAGAAPRPESKGPPIKLVEGIVFGLLAGAAYGTSPNLVRAALAGTSLGILGGAISYLAAGIVLLAIVSPRIHEVVALRLLDRGTQFWFGLSALTIFSAQMFRYLTLSYLPVVIQTPLEQTNGVFNILFSWLLNRESETFAVRILVGISLSIVGSVVLFLPS